MLALLRGAGFLVFQPGWVNGRRSSSHFETDVAVTLGPVVVSGLGGVATAFGGCVGRALGRWSITDDRSRGIRPSVQGGNHPGTAVVTKLIANAVAARRTSIPL